MSAAQKSADRLPVTLVKLGGSLITDKTKPRTVAKEHLRRLAAEIAAGWSGDVLLIGHGSGSFGHPEAEAAHLHSGLVDPGAIDAPPDPMGVARTQFAALELHRIVVSNLLEAGVPAYSQAPSGFLYSQDGMPRGGLPDPFVLALLQGLVPVTMGDVLVDPVRGAAIASTEMVFEFLVRVLSESPLFRVERVVWLGATAGVLDGNGRSIPRIDAANVKDALAAARGSDAVDVTGGMAHRLWAAWGLARQGVESWILDGREPGLLEMMLFDPEQIEAGDGTLVRALQPGRLDPAPPANQSERPSSGGREVP